MSDSAECILVLDDSENMDEIISLSAPPRYEVHFARTIQDAYWKFVKSPESYRLVLLDFNLEGNRPRSNFDGIDLALMIDTYAKWRGLPTPWLVALTTASDELLECFLNLSTDAPLMDVIRKRAGTIVEQLNSLFAALVAQDPTQFQTPYQKRRFKQEIKYDREKLGQLCRTYKERGKDYFERVAGNISKSLFHSYRKLGFSALAPGFSGSEVLSVIAQRSENIPDARTFVIKLCKENTEASRKLDVEIRNYFEYAIHIKDHVPLLIGPFKIKGWNFIAYDFVSVEGRGVSTFADYFSTAIREADFTRDPEVFKQKFSSPHSKFIFDKILKNWHVLHEVGDAAPNTHFFYFKDRNWFKPHLDAAKNKIVAAYDDLKSALNEKHELLHMNLGLGPETLTLSNPLYVVNKLLMDEGYKHHLSGGMVHGDLHSGNILRSLNMYTGDPGQWMLIDFANVIGSAHLAQDGSRLECDIKFQRIVASLRPRFTLEVKLAWWLSLFLGRKLDEVLDMDYWSSQWDDLSKKDKLYGLIECQIQDIRKNTLERLEDSRASQQYSPELDYAVALLMQSLMFVRYGRDPIQTLHTWLAACLAATIVQQYFKAKTNKGYLGNVLGGEYTSANP